MPKVARLYSKFHPAHYELTLTPNADSLTFEGTVHIDGALAASSNTVRLHAKDLTIARVEQNGTNLAFTVDPALDELIITLPAAQTGNISVSVSFNGTITKPMHGLYPCTTNSGSVILATQFESHHAREVFPCVDEPEAKATFGLTLTTPAGQVALANTPAAKTAKQGELLTTQFEITPIMSTYLLAFVVGDMHSVKAKTNNGTEVKVWASRDHDAKSLKFALDTSVRTIEFFNDYFKTPYPLTKCDHVALPDFSSGAMENWGLITYREACLIVDPQKTSANTKEFVATVIAHEISHQWFGNLVTMQWWDDLWLNESFATLMEYIAVDALFPEWDIMLTFASQEALSALWRDSIHGVQSVYCDVTHPDQISTMFDPSIVYAKGARLLLMARNYVGDAAFRKGLQKYFAKHAYGNTKGNDLWQALSVASGKDVSDFMNAWITQSGFPILTVEQTGEKITLTQERFLVGEHTDNKTKWPIPLSPSKKIGDDLFTKKSESRTAANDSFVRINTSGAHMTVRYAQAWQRQALADLIASDASALPPSERLLALNDSLMQARAGVCNITETLELLAAFKNEREETVWNVMSLCIADARRLVEENDEAEAGMKSFVYELVAPLYHELGWEKKKGEPLNDTKLRGTILSLACYSERREIITEALAQYRAYTSPEFMPADTRHILLAVAVKHGTKADFKDLLKRYPTEVNAELQQDICGALCATKNPDNISLLLDNLTKKDAVRLQDVDRWIVYMLRNRWARDASWNWLTSNWEWIETNFASDKSYDHYPRYAASVFSTKKWQKAYAAFFEPLKDEPALKRNIDLGLEEISARVSWRVRDERKLARWLTTL